jgi:hypothetical protein
VRVEDVLLTRDAERRRCSQRAPIDSPTCAEPRFLIRSSWRNTKVD